MSITKHSQKEQLLKFCVTVCFLVFVFLCVFFVSFSPTKNNSNRVLSSLIVQLIDLLAGIEGYWSGCDKLAVTIEEKRSNILCYLLGI
jgi:hypothetical protein